MKSKLIHAVIIAVIIAVIFAVHFSFSHYLQAQSNVRDQEPPSSKSSVEYEMLLEVRILKADIEKISHAVEQIWLKLEIRELKEEIQHIKRLEAKQVYAPKSHWDQQRKEINQKIRLFKEQLDKSKGADNSETYNSTTSEVEDESGK